ncbi:uncharacterized protein LOC123508520 [Portunus trituberculatus]|uniref:uncharacterized protein LOC123508520 n=1 Tax=Portunus trituberculatus TaxID=210409 RepID=UPI001E1CDF75|nr:uncharacterized protein LOC123508520 [Portunus trituberculatus]
MERYLGLPVRLLLALICVLAMVTSKGECVVVVAVENSLGSLCKTFPEDIIFPEGFPSKNATSVGVCLLVKPELTQSDSHSYIASFRTTHVLVNVGITSSITLWLEVNTERHHLNDSLKAEAWNMLCMGLSAAHDTPTPIPEEEHPHSKAYEMWASLQGVTLDVSLGANITAWEEDVWVCVGTRTSWNASFTGFVTGVTLRIGERELTPDNCSLLLDANQLTMPLSESWKTRGPVFALEEDLLQPCDTPMFTLVLREAWGYDKALRWCRSLGGHFPIEKEVTASLVISNCTSEEHLSWTTDASEIAGSYEATCPVLLAGGGVGRRPCLSELECSLCLVPFGLRYTLFGPRTDFNRHYRLSEGQDGSFFFQGTTSNITLSAAGWTLQSSLHRGKLHLNGSWGVMGRRDWRSVYNPQASNILTFTVCNAIQFASNDGVCLRRSERCDGYVQAPDKSDEKECGSRRLLRMDESYDSSVMPFISVEGARYIYYRLSVNVVKKIDAEEDSATLELAMTLKWEDGRVRFVDSKIFYNYFPCHLIWTPTIMMSAGNINGPSVQPAANITMCYFFKGFKDREEVQLDDHLMGRYVTRANISQSRNFLASYPCMLRVSRYPFGRYMCKLAFVTMHHKVHWKSKDTNVNPHTIKYDGDHDLLDYRLENITLHVHDRVLTLTLHLIGQPDYHLISNFLPSALMFFICYSSFYFPIAEFSGRMNVSLTSLVVLLAFFSQATNSYVKTPYYKLIDVWYVLLLLLCCLVVIANGIVNSLRVQRVTAHSNLAKKVLRAKRLNNGCKIVMPILFGLLVFVFVLFATDTI